MAVEPGVVVLVGRFVEGLLVEGGLVAVGVVVVRGMVAELATEGTVLLLDSEETARELPRELGVRQLASAEGRQSQYVLIL